MTPTNRTDPPARAVVAAILLAASVELTAWVLLIVRLTSR